MNVEYANLQQQCNALKARNKTLTLQCKEHKNQVLYIIVYTSDVDQVLYIIVYTSAYHTIIHAIKKQTRLVNKHEYWEICT